MWPTLLSWFCTVVSEGVSVLWTAVKSLDANGSTSRLEPKGEGLKNGADPKGSFPHEGRWAVLERKETDHRLCWCRRRDLNPHGLRHTPLKRACLPFHHFGTQQELETSPQLRSRVAQPLNVLSSTPRAFACCGLVAGMFEAPATRDPATDCRVVSCARFTLHERRVTVEGGAL